MKKMQRREKILAYIVGGLAVAAAGWFLLLGGDARTDEQLEKERERLQSEVQSKQNLLDGAARDSKRLADWRKRSLPSDRGIARADYANWLRGLATNDHFTELTVESKEMETRAGMYTRMAFPVRGHVTLANLTKFLDEFYSAGHLHQIRRINMKPVEHSDNLEVSLTVEALALPNADRTDKLSKEPGRRLQHPKLADYRDPIVKRNLFAPYTPPPPSQPPVVAEKKHDKPASSVDSAQFAIITGFTEVDGVRQVWIQDRMANKMWTLKDGEVFSVGPLKGKVLKIASTQEATIEFDGHGHRFHKGDNLRGGAEVDGHAKN
jgi:hypothetical protein